VDVSWCAGLDPLVAVAVCDTSSCLFCDLFIDCASCIASSCNWCPFSNLCNNTCTNPKDNGGEHFCISPSEQLISITQCDTTGALPWTITWSGGYNDGTNVGGAYLYVVDSTDTPMDCQIDVPITWRYIDKQIIPAMLGIMGVQLCLTAPTTYNSQFHIKPCTAAVELS
jgi:hypothetical protein